VRRNGFKWFYRVIALLGLTLLVVKLVASFWIPEWNPAFYALSMTLGLFAIGIMLFKSIRLKIAENRLGSGLIVLPPLHYKVKKPLTLKRITVYATVFATITVCLIGGGWYANAHHFLQQEREKVCVAQPTPMPKASNVLPPLLGWEKLGSAQFTTTQTSGFLNSPSLGITDAKGVATWVYSPQLVLAGNTYQYAEWYNANVQTSLVIKYTLDGTIHYRTVDSNIPATRGWRHYSLAFDMPDNPGNSDTIPVTVMHQIIGAGRLDISDVILHEQTSSFVRPMISVTFDDGFRGQYINALPLLCQYHIPATFYLISSYVEKGYRDYMLPNMVSQLAEYGMEIGDHTVDHPHLLELSPSEVEAEISDSKGYLKQFGPVVDFASPYGEVNNEDLRLIKQLYQSHRSTDPGVNTADDFDAYTIMCVTIDAAEGTASFAAIKYWIDLAIKTKTWLVLAFHQVDGPGEKYYQDKDPFNTSPVFLGQILSYVHDRHIQPMTMNEGLSEVYQQI